MSARRWQTPRMRIGTSLMWAMVAGMVAVRVIKWLREGGSDIAMVRDFLGYGPNLVAAATLPFFFLGLLVMRAGGEANGHYSWSRLWRERPAQWAAQLISQAGLLGWEFLQQRMPNRTFDLQDITATVAGGVLFAVCVYLGRALTPPGAATSSAPQTSEQSA